MIIVLVGLGVTSSDTKVDTSHSIRFNRPHFSGSFSGADTTDISSFTHPYNKPRATRRRPLDQSLPQSADDYAHRSEMLDLDNLPSARAIQLPHFGDEQMGEDWKDTQSIQFAENPVASAKAMKVARERVSLEKRRSDVEHLEHQV